MPLKALKTIATPYMPIGIHSISLDCYPYTYVDTFVVHSPDGPLLVCLIEFRSFLALNWRGRQSTCLFLINGTDDPI